MILTNSRLQQVFYLLSTFVFSLLVLNFVEFPDIDRYSNYYYVSCDVSTFTATPLANIFFQLIQFPFCSLGISPLVFFSLVSSFLLYCLAYVCSQKSSLNLVIQSFLVLSYYPLIVAFGNCRGACSYAIFFFALLYGGIHDPLRSLKPLHARKYFFFFIIASILVHFQTIFLLLPPFLSYLIRVLSSAKITFDVKKGFVWVFSSSLLFILLGLLFLAPTVFGKLSFYLIYFEQIDSSLTYPLFGALCMSSVALFFSKSRLSLFATLLALISIGLYLSWLGRINSSIYFLMLLSFPRLTFQSRSFPSFAFVFISLVLFSLKTFPWLMRNA